MATYWENSCSFGLRYVSWYKYLIVSLVFSHLGFWSGNLFLIAPFPDLCLLVPFHIKFGFDWPSGFREKIFEKCVWTTDRPRSRVDQLANLHSDTLRDLAPLP